LVGQADIVTKSGHEAQKYVLFTGWTAAATGTVNRIFFNTGVTGQIQFAIYGDTAGVPGTLLGQSGSLTVSTLGINRVEFPSTSVTSGTHYWLVFQSDTNGVVEYVNGIGSANGYKGLSVSPNPAFPYTFPSTAPTTTSFGNFRDLFSAYVEVPSTFITYGALTPVTSAVNSGFFNFF
jgi:hypothetical protein